MVLAAALVCDPPILFLDEPTTGLDPQARHHTWGLINHIKEEGKTIILTTRYMEEAEKLCDRVAIMDYGKIIASVIQVATILIVSILAFKVNIFGSYLLIFLLALFGCALFLNIGFIIAGLVKSTRAVEAIAMVVTMPMLLGRNITMAFPYLFWTTFFRPSL